MKRKIGEQLADRNYVKYLQENITADYYVKPHYFDRLKTKEELEA